MKNTLSAIQIEEEEGGSFIHGKEDTELIPILEAKPIGL